MNLVRNLDWLRTQTQSNRHVVADMYQAMVDRDFKRALAAFDDDSVWVEMGGSARTGEYRGQAEIAAHTTHCWKMTDGTVGSEVLELVGGDHFVVVIERILARRHGVSLNMVVNTHFEMTDGVVHKVQVLPYDAEAWNAFWS